MKKNRKRNRVGRPAIYAEACKLGLHIPRRLRDRLRARADREGQSLNAMIIALLEAALKRKE